MKQFPLPQINCFLFKISQARTLGNKSMEEKLESMTCELAEARERVANLSEEAGNYESSLQQTEGAFMEVVNRELALRNKLDELEKQYTQVMSDRTTLKVGFFIWVGSIHTFPKFNSNRKHWKDQEIIFLKIMETSMARVTIGRKNSVILFILFVVDEMFIRKEIVRIWLQYKRE